MMRAQRFTCLALTVIWLSCLLFSPVQAQYRDRKWGNMPRDGACFYRDAGYRGDYFCVNSGEALWNVGRRFNDEISSIRIFGRARVVVFEHDNFRGSHRVYFGNVLNLYRDFNDKITSIEVQSEHGARDGFDIPNSPHASPRRWYPPR